MLFSRGVVGRRLGTPSQPHEKIRRVLSISSVIFAACLLHNYGAPWSNRFEAINVAMGNTRIAPYSFCVDAHAGLEADIISWEMVSASAFRTNLEPHE